LLVFNDQFDAELHYVEGRLVGVISGNERGTELLKSVFTMTQGEFEFVTGPVLPEEQHDVSLHDAMIKAIKDHYQQRVRAKQESAQELSGATKLSGVHRVMAEPITASPIVSIEKPSRESESKTPGRNITENPFLVGEKGRAITDASGHTIAKAGVISGQESALVALASRLAKNLGTALKVGELERFELRTEDGRGLLCKVTSDHVRLSRITVEADVNAVWERLGS
jgi:hypothetical protein